MVSSGDTLNEVFLSDQSPRCQLEDAIDPWLLTECRAKSNQTAHVQRLITDFAGCTCNLVGNATCTSWPMLYPR